MGNKCKQLSKDTVYTLHLDYPYFETHKPFTHQFKTSSKGMTFLELWAMIWKQYKVLYGTPGYTFFHDIEGIFLEDIEIDYQKKIITPSIGS